MSLCISIKKEKEWKMLIEIKRKTLDEIEDITRTDYERIGKNKITKENLDCMLENLLYEINHYKEKLEEKEKEEN